MVLGTYYDGVEIHRKEKILYARFLVPHRVISTCGAAGGVRDDLAYVYNHQSSEPSGHDHPDHIIAVSDPVAYMALVCGRHGLPENRCAGLGTAANMRCAVIKEERFRDLVVLAACTGGVEGNAGRAGDPATVYEHDGIYEQVSAEGPVLDGTINTILLVNRELTPGAMVCAVMTATEAKAAVMQELAINSRYSNGLATGTGTDQIAVAARLHTGAPLSGAGKHTVLGELIGKTVHDAIKGTLSVQDVLSPEKQRSVVRHLERFGASRKSLMRAVAARLPGEKGRLFEKNFVVLESDPLTVAAVAALVHVRDKVEWGVLARDCTPELWATYGAQVAAAVSGNYAMLPGYREVLAGAYRGNGDGDFLNLVEHAVAMGFIDKWPEDK
ncbi:MAG: adenosylcobinamide amidohydrolase [Syntrophorhabdales bacterium]|jgi:adenosylcobinamide amidohydrolase